MSCGLPVTKDSIADPWDMADHLTDEEREEHSVKIVASNCSSLYLKKI